MPNEHVSRPSRFAVVVEDPTRRWDFLTIGPFDTREQAQAEARHWRQGPRVRAMVRYLWDPDDLRRDITEAGTPVADA